MNLVCAMILSRSGLGLLMGKFSLFLTVIFPPPDIFMLLFLFPVDTIGVVSTNISATTIEIEIGDIIGW